MDAWETLKEKVSKCNLKNLKDRVHMGDLDTYGK
jgi:hypothetical protein